MKLCDCSNEELIKMYDKCSNGTWNTNHEYSLADDFIIEFYEELYHRKLVQQ